MIGAARIWYAHTNLEQIAGASYFDTALARVGAVVAAEDIHIEVPAGQRLSVIGSNGAGKTTFVNMVTGYLRPDAGTIRLAGTDITQDRKSVV